jgi:cytochrome d ubiquinol oxidase subunit II
MDLNALWFILIGVLFTGFFVLEGFDYGVGILLPFLGKDDDERRVIINTIGPFWDGNEVWLLTAGGAIFAAFPHWYATLFSGFYLALVLMLLALILRGVAFEFRSKDARPSWRNFWDWAIFFGSFVPALLWGVAFGNIVRGIPINAQMTYTGDFFGLLNPYALVAGVFGLVVMTLHGAVYLALKTENALTTRARAVASKLAYVALALYVVALVATILSTDLMARPTMPIVTAILGGAALVAAMWFLRRQREGWAFAMTALAIVATVVTIFLTLFPRVLISSTDPKFNLTIYNASSSPYTLTIMTIVAVIFVPIVLAYQGWTYYVFRQRVSKKTLAA